MYIQEKNYEESMTARKLLLQADTQKKMIVQQLPQTVPNIITTNLTKYTSLKLFT